MSEAIGATVHLENVDVVGQAIEKRAGEAFLAERGRPFVERQVRGDDSSVPLPGSACLHAREGRS